MIEMGALTLYLQSTYNQNLIYTLLVRPYYFSAKIH